jgi:tRNA G18 (ribose-2'-O)-methylase SpoU
MRTETRRQRYDNKINNAKTYPFSLCAINFRVDDNFGHLVRSAGCFGAKTVYVIGHIPDRSEIKSSSGSLIDYVNIIQFSTPQAFLEHCKKEKIKVVAAELVEGARSLSSYDFNFDGHTCLVVGNESTGVPTEITSSSDVVYVEMPGVGYCLNTAQTANILLYEAVKQYEGNQG